MLVLDEGGETIHPGGLPVVRLATPSAVVVDAHVEQAERDHLVLVADIAGVVGALEARRPFLPWIPRTPKLLPCSRLQPPGREHDDHLLPPVWVAGMRPAGGDHLTVDLRPSRYLSV